MHLVSLTASSINSSSLGSYIVRASEGIHFDKTAVPRTQANNSENVVTKKIIGFGQAKEALKTCSEEFLYTLSVPWSRVCVND